MAASLGNSGKGSGGRGEVWKAFRRQEVTCFIKLRDRQALGEVRRQWAVDMTVCRLCWIVKACSATLQGDVMPAWFQAGTGPCQERQSRLRQPKPDLRTNVHCANGRSTVSSLMLIKPHQHAANFRIHKYHHRLVISSCNFTDARPAQTTNHFKDPAQHHEASSCSAGRTSQLRLTRC